MSEQLLAQLVESPSDEAYLVYADSLLEQGHAQGELIALAVRADQAERQRAMETALTAELLGELRNVALTWKRGFVDQISMTIGAIDAAANRGLFDRRELALTRTILLVPDRRAKPRDATLVRLADAPIARALKRFELTSIGLPPSSDTLAALLAKCPLLTELAWSPRNLDLAVLEACPRLERLKFWEVVDAATLAQLVALPLRLRGLAVTLATTSDLLPEPVAEIIAGTRFPELTELILRNCGFGNSLLRALPSSPLATRLRVLGLPWLGVDMAAVEVARVALANTQLDYARPATDLTNPPDASGLARVYRLGLERPRDGLAHAETATRASPSAFHVWAELGFAYNDLERDEDTVRALDRALAINPKLWWSRAIRAGALRYLNRRADAELDLKAALEIDPTRAVFTHARLGDLYASWSRIDDARASYGSALELATTSSSHRTYTSTLVTLLLEANDAAAARAVMEAQRPHFEGSDSLRRLDSFVASYEGDGERALAIALEHPAKFEGESRFSWWFAEGAALRALGRFDEAYACYERIVADADCPDWIGLAWLGQTLTGADPFAPIGGVKMHEVNDHIAGAARERGMVVHDSSTHPKDRFSSAISAIAADALVGRSERVRARADAVDAELATSTARRGYESLYRVELLRSAYSRMNASDAARVRFAHLLTAARVAS